MSTRVLLSGIPDPHYAGPYQGEYSQLARDPLGTFIGYQLDLYQVRGGRRFFLRSFTGRYPSALYVRSVLYIACLHERPAAVGPP